MSIVRNLMNLGGVAAAASLLTLVGMPATYAGEGEGSEVIVDPAWSPARAWNEALMEAIRKDFPNPAVHARNLFHSGALMYSVWAAYDEGPSDAFIGIEEHGFSEDAVAEAISFAMYRFLSWRFQNAPQIEITQPMLDGVFDQMDALYTFDFPKEYDGTVGNEPASVGNRYADMMINAFLGDGSNEANNYADYVGYEAINGPIPIDVDGVGIFCEDVPPELEGIPCFTDPNHWQPLAFDFLVLQNGIVIGAAIQEIVAPWGGYVTPFALPQEQFDPVEGIYSGFDPGMPPQLNAPDDLYREYFVEDILRSRDLDPTSGPGAELVDIGPATHHNNSLGTDDGTGYSMNPYTGEPYEPVMVPLGDYARCLAEFWADGPKSETPPGHWHVVANDASDKMVDLGIPFQINGQGPVVSRLEWDVKTYFGMGGAVHDAAVVAWGLKRFYDYARPITGIRYMGIRGQNTDPDGDSYHPDGLPLIPGVIEVITEDEVGSGGKFEHLVELVDNGFDPPFIDNHVGDIAINCWQGHPEDQENEIGGIGWILAMRWLPYQLTTFVTPAFPGYVSGHSTFSRAAAEYLSDFTGSEYYPGGIGEYHFTAHEYLVFEDGPSVDVTLTWAKYKDAADEAGISRRYGGIHPAADDYPGRVLGFDCGNDAWALAKQYFDGDIVPNCPGDLTGDGMVDSTDLNQLLAAFGSTGNGDLDNDFDTDSADLNLLLAAFGDACP